MNLHYLILAHTQPAQVRRLVDRLLGPNTYFYVNIDASVELQPFIEAFRGSPPEVNLLSDRERYATSWGDISLVDATLNLLRLALATDKDGYCILMSGQDYPLRSNQRIRNFFQQRPTTNYLESFKLPTKLWCRGGMARINDYKFNLSGQREDCVVIPPIFTRRFFRLGVLKRWTKALARGKLIAHRKLLRRRKFPAYLEPYGGEHWWALTTDTVKDVLAFLIDHPDYRIYHEDTVLVEEIFLHSIVNHLYRDRPERIAPKVTYANWNEESESGPVNFRLQDLDLIKGLSPSFLFARKFDQTEDAEILNALDAYRGEVSV
ncbi:beta-1,6-N-acetylglucosaminyltransferase [Neolewinella antarctica]|uniref:Peptide O-xylosyltransferase n=1 Tax=Neolewinella antarctica TaxID=442734 RepID=A0ABX0XFX3_9BACT|nr:beta-1,6-N-acetylglucosaminyltransferase [Neolewinella antarctica]NJC27779.1 hypothetical protein [Neolewinella antarctica]